jgi:hypothetical protein
MSVTNENVLDYQVETDGANRFFQRVIPFLLTAALPLVLIGCVICLGAASPPVTVIGVFLFGLMFLAFGGLCWLIAILGCRSEFRRSRIRTFLATPILTVLLFVLLLSDLPRVALFYVNKPALDRFANLWMNSPNPPTSGRAGVYLLYDITPIPGGFVAYVAGSNGYLVRGAFAYSPQSPPATHAGTPTPAGAGWYFLCCDTD